MALRQRRMRGTRDAEGAKAAILAAALRTFAANGLAGAHMAVIARQAMVAKGLVFHHFRSKAGLWIATLEHVYALLHGDQDEAALEALGPIEGMRRLAHDTFRLFRAHPDIVARMNEENLHRARHLRAAKRTPQSRNPLLATIGRLLTAGRAQRAFREDVDATALAIAMSGLGAFYCAHRWTLSAAFAGDLFRPDRIGANEAMLGEKVAAYLRRPAPSS